LIDSLHSRVSPLVDYRIGVRNRWFWGDVDSLLLSLFVSNHGSGNGASRGRTVREFLKLWGKDLYYENPTFRDIRPGLLESYRWLQKGLTRSKAREGQGPAVVATQPAAASTALPARGESGARIVSALDKAGLDEQAWNALAAASETHSVFQTHQWMRSWLSVFGDQCEPLFVTAFNGSAPAAVAPLMVEQSPYGERVIKFLGDGRADYCDVLAAEGKASLLSDIFEALRKYGRWDIIELNSIPEHSQTVPMLRTFCEQSGSRFLIDDHFVCPTLLIEGHEASAQKILSKSSLRRAQNYFERSGRVERRNLTGAVEIDPYLDRFFSQHVRRWSGTPSPSLFLNPRNQAFYRNLAHCLSGTHWLLFSVVEFNGNPVAFHYGFDYDGVVMWYKPSFDITHAAHSPGMLMVRHLLDYAIGQRRRELDFTVGDEAFKRRFTNQKRKTVRIQIFRDSARYMYERSRRTVLTAMKKTLDAVGAADHADRAVAK
jgi:CelD/BcsL family acetyltransferase involved in cellulose biosynthesis